MAESDANNDEGRLPESKQELLDRIASAWADLGAVITDLPEELLVTPGAGGWSIKDNLAHLAAWEQFMLGHYLERRPAHEVFGLDEERFRGLDEDGTNQVVYERNRDRSPEEVLEAFRDSHARVVQSLEAASWDDLTAPFPGDGEGRPVLVWVAGNTYDHYREHRDYIIRLQTPAMLGD